MRRAAFASTLALLSLGAAPRPPMLPLPQKVSFPSADGTTVLTGYLFRPETKAAAQAPAVVMMHGRGGVYSSLANGDYSAKTISRRHQEWGHIWARQGYFALMVDGFGPRGYAKGFPRYSYDQRPKELDEVNVRPLDAYGALIFLRKQNGVAGDKIVLQGWSNGASATLAAMAAREAPGLGQLTPANGFRAGAGVLSGVRAEGAVPGRSRDLRAGAAVSRQRGRRGVAAPLPGPRRAEPQARRRHRRSRSMPTPCTVLTIPAASGRASLRMPGRRRTRPRRRWRSLRRC